jgi:hypothetical protein
MNTLAEGNVQNQILWARIAYWTGAIAALIVGIVVFFPAPTEWLLQLDEPMRGAGLMSSKYFGTTAVAWALFLLWADRRPLERKGILPLTIFPVLVGLIAVGVYAAIEDIASTLNMGLLIGPQIMLLILFGFSYMNARETG